MLIPIVFLPTTFLALARGTWEVVALCFPTQVLEELAPELRAAALRRANISSPGRDRDRRNRGLPFEAGYVQHKSIQGLR
jgi:hypothetical protein